MYFITIILIWFCMTEIQSRRAKKQILAGTLNDIHVQ